MRRRSGTIPQKTSLSPFEEPPLYEEAVARYNLNWLREELPKTENITYVDFDAFGIPNEQITLFFKNHPVERMIVVNVTDGALLPLSRLGRVDLERHYLIKFSEKRGDYVSQKRLTRLLPLIQEQFIHVLALRHGFNTAFLYHAMNLKANVTYYGFIAYPETGVKLRWATGKTPIIKYKDLRSLPIRSLLKQRKNVI